MRRLSNLRKSVVRKSKERIEYCLRRCRRYSLEKWIRELWWVHLARRASHLLELRSQSTGKLTRSSFWIRQLKAPGGCINRKWTMTMPSCSTNCWRSKAITMLSSGSKTVDNLSQPWTRVVTPSTPTFSKLMILSSNRRTKGKAWSEILNKALNWGSEKLRRARDRLS